MSLLSSIKTKLSTAKLDFSKRQVVVVLLYGLVAPGYNTVRTSKVV